MNNFENRCFSLLVDMLTNRPRDLSGRTVLYDNEDRTKYLDIIKSQKIEIEQNKIVPSGNRKTLVLLYGFMIEMLTHKLI